MGLVRKGKAPRLNYSTRCEKQFFPEIGAEPWFCHPGRPIWRPFSAKGLGGRSDKSKEGACVDTA